MNRLVLRFSRTRILGVLALAAVIMLAVMPAPAAARKVTVTYLPVLQNKTDLDLTVRWVEVTQAVQTESNSVALVAGRATLARVYAEVLEGVSPDGVTAQLSGEAHGIPLPGSPLTSDPMRVPNTARRADLRSTFNFLLPDSWLAGDVTLTARVDGFDEYQEKNEANNSQSFHATFHLMAPLDIVIVPIQYTDMPSGEVYPPSSDEQLSDYLLQIYPVSQVNARLHPPVAFSGDLTSDSAFSSLLDTITRLKITEGAAPSTVYYGLIPIKNEQGLWFSSGIAGMGWINSRVSIGLDINSNPYHTVSTGEIAAHELGHNFGRPHTPCSSINGDESYPYEGGFTGQDGVNVPAMRLFAAADTYDIMSYCHPQWISDWTYSALLENQLLNGGSPGWERKIPGPALLISAAWQGGGVSLAPVEKIKAPFSLPPGSGYILDLVDGAGSVLASYPSGAYLTGDGDFQALYAVVPDPPGNQLRSVRLSDLSGAVLAERAVP